MPGGRDVVADQRTSLQEFVELVRQGKMMAAIKYARGYLSDWASVYLQELQVCVLYKHQIATLRLLGCVHSMFL